jgi:small subunit ribosomal protein S1
VTSLADFGAFVNINGADGLVHLSEISWDHIDHPKDVLKVGQEIDVKIISIDHEKNRIGLSIRQLANDPWDDHIKEYQVGQLVEGTITRLTKFGAFAQIDENLEGLIHISELSERRVEHPKEVLTVGDVVTLRVIKIDTNRRRIGLSLRKVESLKYSDMDWEMALAEFDTLSDDDEDEVEEAIVADTPAEDSAPEAEQPAEAAAEDEVAEDPPTEDSAPEVDPEQPETADDEPDAEEEPSEE